VLGVGVRVEVTLQTVPVELPGTQFAQRLDHPRVWPTDAPARSPGTPGR
jgi:hypothetical protein